MQTRLIAAAVAAAALLTSCATAYQKSGLGGGYTDHRISESAYYVEFAGNGYASGERVHTFWLYRCAELTLQHGFNYMVLKPGERKAQLDESRAPRAWPAVWHPDEERARPIEVSGGGYSYYYVPGYSVTTYDARGTVLMYHAPLPDEVPWAIDAAQLKEQLKPYMDSNGKLPAPKTADMASVIGVAHELIRMPDAGQISVEAVYAGGSTLPLRAPTEITEAMTGAQIGLHVMFHSRKAITGGSDGGRINLALTVSPNGMVTTVDLVDTTFKDRSFVDAVRLYMKKVEFKPRDVATSRVAAFPIDFTPIY